MNKTHPGKLLQGDTTYYSYQKPQPFYKRLFAPKGVRVWAPYCERCRKWVYVYDRMLGVSVTENIFFELQESDIIQRLFHRDWSVLQYAEKPYNWTTAPTIFMSLGHCGTCDGPFALLGEIHGQSGKTLYLGGLFSVEIDNKSALELLEIALDRNLTVNDAMDAKAVAVCQNLGSSKDFAQLALVRQRKAKAREFGLRGMNDLAKGRLDEAEANLTSALQIFEELGERKLQAVTYRNLASVYCRRKALNHAETLLKKSLELFEEFQDKPEMALDYGFLGTIYFDRKEFDRAELLFRKALEMVTTLGDKRAMVTGYHALGLVHKALEKRGQARDAFAEALKLCKELGDKAFAKALQTELDQLNV